jgi:hypothetical protein
VDGLFKFNLLAHALHEFNRCGGKWSPHTTLSAPVGTEDIDKRESTEGIDKLVSVLAQSTEDIGKRPRPCTRGAVLVTAPK